MTVVDQIDVLGQRERARAKVEAERCRLARMLADAAPPDECGPEMVAAPARGDMKTFIPVKLQLKPSVEVGKADADYILQHDGFFGRSAARTADVFDRMALQSRRAKGAVDPRFVLNFGRVSMARFYRDLTERHEAGGMRCASLETQGGRSGGGGSGEWIDTFVQEGRQLAALHRRIGGGSALAVRRVRPSARGTKTGISDRVLVDMVCLRDMDLSAVLVACGWSADGKNRASIREALCGALDRMQGYPS